MKKKSPPYAIIVAVILGCVAVAAFIKHEKDVAAASADAVETQRKADQAAIDAANAKQTVAVLPLATNTRLVLYATSAVESGVRISSAFYEKKLTPDNILPDAFSADNDLVGWFAIRKIEKGDPLTPRNIAKTLSYMTERIPPGMRLMTLPTLNTAADTAGFVVDGDKVDLFFTTAAQTQLVMQNLSVLFVPGSKVKTDKTDGVEPIPPGIPAFLVTPEQAQALLFLSQDSTGKFNMLLRSRSDTEPLKIRPFVGTDVAGNLGKVDKITRKSDDRVADLQRQLEELQKKNAGTPNETQPVVPNP